MLLHQILLQLDLPNHTKLTKMMTSKKLSPWNLSPMTPPKWPCTTPTLCPSTRWSNKSRPPLPPWIRTPSLLMILRNDQTQTTRWILVLHRMWIQFKDKNQPWNTCLLFMLASYVKYVNFIAQTESHWITWIEKIVIVLICFPDLNYLINSKMSNGWVILDTTEDVKNVYESKYKKNVMVHVESKHANSHGNICPHCCLVRVNRKGLSNHIYRYHKS